MLIYILPILCLILQLDLKICILHLKKSFHSPNIEPRNIYWVLINACGVKNKLQILRVFRLGIFPRVLTEQNIK